MIASHEPLRITRRAEVLAAGAAFLALALGAAIFARDQYFTFDESYHLNVSETLAATGTYASGLLGEFIPFDPAVTTGPTVILPLGIAIRIFGDEAAIVRGTLVVSTLFYLALAFWAVREIFGRAIALAFLVVAGATPLFLPLGITAQGDVPAICLALCALALLDRAERAVTPRSRLSLLLASGASLGLAVLAKDLLLLLVVAALAVVGVGLLEPGARRRALPRALPGLLALGVAFGWRGYQYFAMRVSAPAELPEWLAAVESRAELLRTRVVYSPLSHVAGAIDSAFDTFAPSLIAFGVGLSAVLWMRHARGVPLDVIDRRSSAQAILLAASILWCVWFFFVSGPEVVDRHLLPGIVFLELLALRFASRLWLSAASRSPGAGRVGYSLAGVLTLLLAWGVANGLARNRAALRGSRNALVSQRGAALWLETNTPATSPVSGWGWYVPWHVSFLADRTPSRVDLHDPSLKGLTDWLVLIPETTVSGVDERLREFLVRRARLEYSDGGYEIYSVGKKRPAREPGEAKSGKARQAALQLRAILGNVRAWREKGRRYAELDADRAVREGLLPPEMIRNGRIENPFGGPVDIRAMPPDTTRNDTFVLVFSGVPREECVRLAFPPDEDYLVYAGAFRRAPTSEEQARELCATGNMWFVAR